MFYKWISDVVFKYALNAVVDIILNKYYMRDVIN